MKKLFVILASASIMFASVNANAQSISTLLKNAANAAANAAVSSATGSSSSSTKASNVIDGITNLVYAYTGNTTAVVLPGTWTYLGSAIALDGESTVATLAGTAVSSSAESKINSTLEKFGFTAGAVTFVFNEDLSFTCTFRGVPLNGTWKTLNDGTTVQLQFGKTMKYLSMTGDLKKTANGCEMLFGANKFLSFVKTALAVAGQSSSLGTLSSLSNNYKGMKIGFELKQSK